jgi:hypothetical protein
LADRPHQKIADGKTSESDRSIPIHDAHGLGNLGANVTFWSTATFWLEK